MHLPQRLRKVQDMLERRDTEDGVERLIIEWQCGSATRRSQPDVRIAIRCDSSELPVSCATSEVAATWPRSCITSDRAPARADPCSVGPYGKLSPRPYELVSQKSQCRNRRCGWN